MPGHEHVVAEYLFNKRGALALSRIGNIKSIGVPGRHGTAEVGSLGQLHSLLSTEDSRKKADVYVNGVGVSVKQSGGSFSYNRLQRANLEEVFSNLGFENIEAKLDRADAKVLEFHEGKLPKRNRPWKEFFSEPDFRELLHYLMMVGSPNVGTSSHPAELILECPVTRISPNNISVYTFVEYFEKYRGKFMIAIRRQWVGQNSKSEHGRAVGLAKKEGNRPWVFDDVAGEPRSGWRGDFPEDAKKTVYFLMVEKVA